MDWPFRFSLISDIIEGLNFLHSSPIEFHGRLKSTNCVIDRRLVVKLTDYGLKTLMTQSAPESRIDPRQLLWTAPEHLRQKRPELRGSAKGDVYSFAIVLQEIVTRSGPFETPIIRGVSCGRDSLLASPNPHQACQLPAADAPAILARVRRIPVQGRFEPFRPLIAEEDCPPLLAQLIYDCWQEEPNSRPNLDSVRQQFKKLSK